MMANRFDQARALVQNARKRLPEPERQYKESLQNQSVDVALQVEIKGIVENLRSALDYVACELGIRHGSVTQGAKVYFPIAQKNAKEADFASLVGKNIPGLPKNRPDLVGVLKGFQAFAFDENDWLPDLATLANENKHERLTPQTRTEQQRIHVTPNDRGGTASWNPTGVRFGGPGASIFGVPVDPQRQVPVPSPTQTVTREIWVDFLFDVTERSVLAFLKQAIDGVQSIVNELESKA